MPALAAKAGSRGVGSPERNQYRSSKSAHAVPKIVGQTIVCQTALICSLKRPLQGYLRLATRLAVRLPLPLVGGEAGAGSAGCSWNFSAWPVSS